MRPCIYKDREAGKCKWPKVLPISERAKLAKKVLDQDPKCDWKGFDPIFNRRMSYQAGASDYTLWIAADC